MTTAVRVAPFVILLVVLAVYHGTGPHFMFWPDSEGYLALAESLWSPADQQNPSGRTVGYPLFVSAVFAVSHSALALILAQALLVILAYTLLHRHLKQAIWDLTPAHAQSRARLSAWLGVALAATTSYSALHVFILSLLPEILHAVLVLVAALAVTWFVTRETTTPGLLWRATIPVAVAASLPVLVKPHWLFGAHALIAVVAAKLAWSELSSRPRGAKSTLRAGLALALPFGLLAAVMTPDIYLASANPSASLFGPRSLFCNNLHILDDVLKARPGWRLDPDPARNERLKSVAREVRGSDTAPWYHLGYNGDHCMYNARLPERVSAELPNVTAERNFYMLGFKTAVLGDPLRFAGKVFWQIAVGLQRSFAKFSYHLASPGQHDLPDAFFTGTSRAGEAGPLRSKSHMKDTLYGRVVEALLALIFVPLTIAYLALFSLTLVATPLRLQHWTPQRRRLFAGYVGVPVLAILAHHALVGVAHTFDVWRYAFGVFFLNIAFVATAGLFWYGEFAHRLRFARPLTTTPSAGSSEA